eukprot:3245361-Rhodomonas_salina.3
MQVRDISAEMRSNISGLAAICEPHCVFWCATGREFDTISEFRMETIVYARYHLRCLPLCDIR